MTSVDSLLSWNVGPGRSIQSLVMDLRQLILKKDDIVALCEVTPRNARLLKAAFPGWRVLHPRVGTHGKRRSDVVVMVRRRLPKPDVRVIAHSVAWVGPK